RHQHRPVPPPKFAFAPRGESRPRMGQALDSIVCAGGIVSGGHVERSMLGPQVRVNSWAAVEDSILFEGVEVGRHARIRRAIIDKDTRIPEGTQIGFDPDADRARRFVVTDTGLTVIGKLQSWPSSRRHEVGSSPSFLRRQESSKCSAILHYSDVS